MHLIFNIVGLNKGGAERVVSTLANEMVSANHKVTIIKYICDEVQYFLNNKIEVITIDEDAKDSKRNKIIRFLKRRKKLLDEIYKINGDIIISFLPESNFTLLSLFNKIEIPIIVSLRNDPRTEYSNMLYNIMMRKFYPKASGYIFQTQDALDYFKFNERIYNLGTVIPNPIHDEFLNHEIIDEKNNQVVAVGRLVKQKNHELLIRVFHKLMAKYNNISLSIYGEGKLKAKITKTIKKLNVVNNIVLYGEVNDIAQRIRDSRLYVLSSKYEGLPNSLMEAMALGIPVISTDCPSGGPKSLINNEVNGLLVKNKNFEELYKAMDKMLGNLEYSKKLAQNAHIDMKKYQTKNIYEKWINYIESKL